MGYLDDSGEPFDSTDRPKVYLDENGNPVSLSASAASSPKKYLDDNGEPISAVSGPGAGDAWTQIDRSTRTLRTVPDIPPSPGGAAIDAAALPFTLRGLSSFAQAPPVPPQPAAEPIPQRFDPETGTFQPELAGGYVRNWAKEGPAKIARGALGLTTAPGGALVESGIPGVRLSVPTARAPFLNAASDVVEGAFKTGEPLMAAGAVAAPLPTAAALGLGMAGQAGVQRGLQAIGAPEDVSRFGGNVGALVAGGLGAKGGHYAQQQLGTALGARRIGNALEAELTRPEPPVPPRLVKGERPPVRPVEPRVEAPAPEPFAEVRPPSPAPEEAAPVVSEPAVIMEARKLVAEEPVTPQEVRGAIQEPGAAPVDVRNAPGDGRALGGRNAEGQETPGARLEEEAPPVGPRPAPEEAVTPKPAPPVLPKTTVEIDQLPNGRGFTISHDSDVKGFPQDLIWENPEAVAAHDAKMLELQGAGGAGRPAHPGVRRKFQTVEEAQTALSSAGINRAMRPDGTIAETKPAPPVPGREAYNAEHGAPLRGDVSTTLPGGPVEPGRLPERAPVAQPADTARAAEHARLFDSAVQRARDTGYTGSPDELRARFDDRLNEARAIVRDLDTDAASAAEEFGDVALLREIAKAGGIGHPSREGTYPEIARAFWDASTGTRDLGMGEKGARKVKYLPTGDIAGVRRVVAYKGRDLDSIREHLAATGRFPEIKDIRDLEGVLGRILEAERNPQRAKSQYGISVEEALQTLDETDPEWWTDTSFNPETFEAPVVDITEAGEQPRLPGAVGAVREQEIKTPEWEAPFSLEAEAAPAKAKQETLFNPAKKGEPVTAAQAKKLADAYDREFEAGGGERPTPEPAPRKGVLGLPMKAALVRTRHAIAKIISPNADQLRPSEIVKGLSKMFEGLPVREGVGRHRGVLGYYAIKPQTVHLRVANSLDVAAHEFGHHLDIAVLGLPRAKQPYTAELMALGAETSRPSYPPWKVRREGAAEFTRLWLSEPEQAKAGAPQYYDAFEKGLAQQPDLARSLTETQRQVIGHLASDPVARAESRIDFKGVDPKAGGDVVTRMQTAWVDDLTPLRKMVEDLAEGRPVNALESGYVLARLARGASTKATGFLKYGVKDYDGTEIAGSFDAALKPVQKHVKDFATYLVASRVPELRGRGIETGMSSAEAHAVITKFETPEFLKARQAVYDFQNGVLTYLEKSGLATPEQIAKVRALNERYVPFQRVIDQVEGRLSGGGSKQIANRSNPLKRIKGSGYDIVNPLESIVRNTHAIVETVEANRAMLALVKQARKTTGGGSYLEQAAPPQVATKFNLSRLTPEIRKALKEAGVEDLPDNLVDALDEAVTVFTPAHFPTGKGGVVTVMEKGKRQWYEVNDRAVYDAITAVGTKSPAAIINLFMRPARVLRAGATTTLGFAARNPIRDTWTAAVNTRYGFKLGYDTLKGLFEFATHGEDYQQFLNSGGGNSAMVAMDRNRIRDYLGTMGTSRRLALARSIPQHPLELLRAISEATENATRLGEFMRAVQKEGRSPEGYARAALAARDVTIDFARAGTQGRAMNQYVPFFNAGLQGVARLGEVFKRDPIGATTKAVLTIQLPTIALWYLNHDNEEYREKPAWERNTYWHVPLTWPPNKAKDFARIPKPFELGNIFGNVTEAALDYLDGKDKNIAKRLFPNADSALDAFTALMPSAVLPLMEAKSNYDTFRDRAIVSPWDLGLDKELQYGRWTSEVAKIVGPKIGLAPSVFDHLVYGYTAGLGRGVVQGMDLALEGLGLVDRNKPTAGPARWPLVGAFYSAPAGADAQSIKEFYDLKEAMAGKEKSIKTYAETDPARAKREADEFKAQHQNAAAFHARVGAADTKMKNLRRQVETVMEAKDKTPDQKSNTLGRLYEKMVNTAREALGKAKLPPRFDEDRDPNAKIAPPVPVRQVASR